MDSKVASRRLLGWHPLTLQFQGGGATDELDRKPDFALQVADTASEEPCITALELSRIEGVLNCTQSIHVFPIPISCQPVPPRP